MTAARRRVSILGSTGSVGSSTLSLLASAGVDVDMVALVGGRNADLLAEQARQWRPQIVVISDELGLPRLQDRLRGMKIEVAAGAQAVVAAARAPADWVMCSIVGFAGLRPTLAAAETGAAIALANKESLVCAGPRLLQTARQAGGRVIPVDSEHSAIFQVLEAANASKVHKLILTASGGPFRTWTVAQMDRATVDQALAHPRWRMGAKISVDSATMMNKALEIIEAAHLFGMPSSAIDVVVHPQSIVHSLVQYSDGSTLAQLGVSDMRVPIACAFAWPERLAWPAEHLDLAAIGRLDFEPTDARRFPALDLAREALRLGGAAPICLNAADEVAVQAFLEGRIGFMDIVRLVAGALERFSGALGHDEPGIDDIVETDAHVRRWATEASQRLALPA